MKLLYAFLVFTNFFFVVGCQVNSNKNTQTKADTINFFPIRDFILEDIKDVSNTPYSIQRISIQNNIRDSSILDNSQFKQLANIFLERDSIISVNKNFYLESTFHDLTTKSYSFTYTSNNPNVQTKNIIVLVDDENNKLKNIFIQSIITKSDTTFFENLSWNYKRNFQITNTIKVKQGSSIETRILVKWNDK